MPTRLPISLVALLLGWSAASYAQDYRRELLEWSLLSGVALLLP